MVGAFFVVLFNLIIGPFKLLSWLVREIASVEVELKPSRQQARKRLGEVQQSLGTYWNRKAPSSTGFQGFETEENPLDIVFPTAASSRKNGIATPLEKTDKFFQSLPPSSRTAGTLQPGVFNALPPSRMTSQSASRQKEKPQPKKGGYFLPNPDNNYNHLLNSNQFLSKSIDTLANQYFSRQESGI